MSVIIPNVMNRKNAILSRAMTFLSEEDGIGKEIFDELATLMDKEPLVDTVSKLLPCPFCASQPIWINEAVDDDHYYIKCPYCHIVMKEDRRDKVIGMWNTRK